MAVWLGVLIRDLGYFVWAFQRRSQVHCHQRAKSKQNNLHWFSLRGTTYRYGGRILSTNLNGLAVGIQPSMLEPKKA